MPQPKCKDYIVFKVRCYASEYMLNKYGPSCSQHQHRAKQNGEFFWKFFEFTTKKNSQTFIKDHMCFTSESAIEELEYDHNILRQDREGSKIYFIPVEKTEIIAWVKNNLNSLPFKILKKTFIGFHYKVDDKLYWRKQGLQFSKEWEEKIVLIENTRKVLIEKKRK